MKEKYNVEIQYFSALNKKINFCKNCDYCVRNNGECISKDDMTQLYEFFNWADGMVIGSPVYQGQLSGQLKTIFDRCRALVVTTPSFFENKVGMGIAVGGDRNGGQEAVLHGILDFYLANQVLPVSGGAIGANLGGTFWSKDLGKKEVDQDEEGWKSVKRTVKMMMKRLQQITPTINNISQN